MTEEVPVVDNSAAALSEPVNAPDLPLLGTLLVAARERWNLSAADLARQLRLGLRQVQALEEDRFDALPGNTFVRGFIRNYARVVQTEPDAFLDAYERSRPQVRQYDIERGAPQIAFQRKVTPKWVWYLVILFLLLLLSPLIIYFALRDEENSSKVVKPINNGKLSAPQSPAAALPLPQSQPMASQAITPSITSGALATAPAPSNPPATIASIPAAGEATLTLRFNGDAWVEIQNKTGKIIFSQLNHSGQEQVIQGKPPFTLVVGNASKVRIAYNGKPVDLLQHTKINVARFKLE